MTIYPCKLSQLIATPQVRTSHEFPLLPNMSPNLDTEEFAVYSHTQRALLVYEQVFGSNDLASGNFCALIGTSCHSSSRDTEKPWLFISLLALISDIFRAAPNPGATRMCPGRQAGAGRGRGGKQRQAFRVVKTSVPARHVSRGAGAMQRVRTEGTLELVCVESIASRFAPQRRVCRKKSPCEQRRPILRR